MKALIAVTCVAVLLAIGYYFVKEQRQAAAAAGIAERYVRLRQCREELSKPDGERDGGIIVDCFASGLLTKSDLNSAGIFPN